MSFLADTVEMPRTVPSSAMQNSATSGQPGPAMGSSCSRPRRPPPYENVAAVWMDSGGWRSAHRAASDELSGGCRILGRAGSADGREQRGRG